MPIRPGSRLGPYEVVGVAGTGGMGEVYRARDTRLGRAVAIKFLPQHLAGDPQFRERFDREARAVSQLAHANICVLYDVGEVPSAGPHTPAPHFLVMEYLEGETLAARLARGRLAIPEALRIAADIASALDHAHRHGIVHRDLKPGNVMLTKSGLKLLDFGLAKAAAGVVANLDDGPLSTVAAPLTERGTILGTLRYMAPEQIDAGETDARTDIFAFGVVLYEMLTGEPPFRGNSQASVLSAILKDDPPPLAEVLPVAPAALDHLVHVCLAKDPDDRFQTMRDVWLEVKWIADGSRVAAAAVDSRSPERVRWAVGALLLAAAAAAGGWWFKSAPAARLAVTRLEYPLPPSQDFSEGGRRIVAISPDGTRLAYIANRQIYLRQIDQLDAHPLIGSGEFPTEPVFSPDGRWIAYFSSPPGIDQTHIRKVSVTGGAPVPLATFAGAADGATWRRQLILFGQNNYGVFGIRAIAESGGTVRTLVSVDGARERAVQPDLLDDGQHLIFSVPSPASMNPTHRGEGPIVVQAIGGTDRRVLVPMGLHPRVLPTGHLTYVHNGTLYAVAFDAALRTVSGDTMPLVEGIPFSSFSAVAQFAVSQNGSLIYGQGVPTATSFQLASVDRSGLDRQLPVPVSRYQQPRLSPDKRRLVVSSAGQISMWTFATETLMRVTTNETQAHFNPAWMGNSHVVYDAADTDGSGGHRIVRRSADGAGSEEVIVPAPAGYPNAVAADGRFLIFHPAARVAMLVPLQPRGEARPLLPNLKGQVSDVEFSPDGRWIAFESNESGRFEVYVRPFPDVNAGRFLVSSNGGQHPLWSRDGRELFYIAEDGMMMAVPIELQPTFSHERPARLFPAAHYFVNVARNYDQRPDGSGFIMVKSRTASARQSIVVVTNWFEEVRTKMSAARR